MNQANTDPLPIGRYWIELSREHAVAFAYWRHEAVEAGLIVEERVEHDPNNGWSLYVWRVIKPVPWYAEDWGWPNIADAATMDKWKPPAPGAAQRAKAAERWQLVQSLLLGVGTLVVATLLIQRFGTTGKDSTV